MSNLKKRMSLILSIIMLALAVFPVTVTTASSNSKDVEMTVKLNGDRTMEYDYQDPDDAAYEYFVKNGDTIEVSAKSTNGSYIAFIGYYYDDDVKGTKNVYKDTLTITLPTEKVGTTRLLAIDAVAQSNKGPNDDNNRTGWQYFWLTWVEDDTDTQSKDLEANVKFDGNVLADMSTTTDAAAGDELELYATPSENAKEIYYFWDTAEPAYSISGASGKITIPSTFEAGSTHYLYVIARDKDGNDSPQKSYKFIIADESNGSHGNTDNPTKPSKDNDDELDVLPWEKENNELDSLAVALRNDSESKKKNKNIYALNEEVTYYVDYKNGGKDITDKVVLKLELPLKFDVIDADGGTVDKSKGTITWTYNGMEEEQEGTKIVKIKYTGFDKKSTEYETVYPLATIAKDTKIADESAVINLIYEDEDTVIDDVHTPYMYGDRDTPTFRPNDTITRAEGALVLTRILLGQRAIDNVTIKSVYPDLDETYLEAQKAILAATSYGIINGYTDGYYRPNTTMTRAEFMKILATFIEINAEDEGIDGLQIKPVDESVKIYKDLIPRYMVNGTTVTTHWAIEEVTLLTRLNMTGTKEDRDLRLDENITRAEVAQLVNFFSFRAPAEVSSRTTTKFTDVTRNHKLFGDIVEATRAAHEYSFTEDGTEIAE